MRFASTTRLVSASFDKGAEKDTSMKSAKKKVTANPKSVPTDTLKNVEPKEFASMEMTVPINIKKKTTTAQ